MPIEFIEPIGKAVLVSQYLDDALLSIGMRLDDTFYEDNRTRPSGALVLNLTDKAKAIVTDADLSKRLLSLCEDAGNIFKARNEIVHSRGHTESVGDQGRHYRGKTAPSPKYLSPEVINTFIEEAAGVAVKANGLLHDKNLQW